MTNQTRAASQAIRNDLIGQVERRQAIHTQSQQKYADVVYSSICFAFDFVNVLQHSQPDLERFLKHDFWSGKKHLTVEKQLPRLVLRFIVGANTAKGALYEKARAYAQVVEYYLSLEFSTADMQEDLKTITLEGAYERIKQRKQVSSSSNTQVPPRRGRYVAHPDDDLYSDNPSDTDLCLDRYFESAETAEIDLTASDSNGSNDDPDDNALNLQIYPFDTFRELAIRMDEHQLKQVFEMKSSDLMYVKLRRDQNNGEWSSFRAVNIFPLPGDRPKRGR